MKQYKHNFFRLIVCCLVISGCDNYLEIMPKGVTLLTTVDDYDRWLNEETLARGISGTSAGRINYLGDNVDLVNITSPPTTISELVYIWALQFSTDMTADPVFWGEHYAKINQFNTVLLGVDQATGGSASRVRSLKAEAFLGRALEYFYLLNLYGKPYDAATADQDLAVPFVTSNDVSQVVPPRSTVAEVYKQIIDDINIAIPDLSADNSSNRYRGSRAAAYSVLARIYFYTRNYPEAQRNAELALQQGNAIMIDFNGDLPPSSYTNLQPDVIYGRAMSLDVPVTLDFMRSFANDDLRVRMFYLNADNYTFTIRGSTTFLPHRMTPILQLTNTGTSVQEMKLIIAECAARSNDLPLALQQLDDVRKNRFATASYVRFESSDQEAVLQEVLKERRHELPFSGLRWFDMRRLDKENRMQTVNRYNAAGDLVASLPPGSDRYTLQIPIQALSFNPGMPQNP